MQAAYIAHSSQRLPQHQALPLVGLWVSMLRGLCMPSTIDDCRPQPSTP